MPSKKVSVAYYTIKQPKNLLVFVHGFGGKAIQTWNDFNYIIKYHDEFQHTDVIFYGYPSLRRQISSNALLFYNDLKGYITSCPFRSNTSYEKVVLAGHSLGALIIRKALLAAKFDEVEWLSRCKMVLFAPAHKGSRNIQGLAMECLSGAFKMVGNIAHLVFPVLNDLKADSITITDLIKESEAYLAKSDGEFTRSTKVAIAVEDKVVINDKFCKDPNSIPILDKSHAAICKPHVKTYTQPWEMLAEVLK